MALPTRPSPGGSLVPRANTTSTSGHDAEALGGNGQASDNVAAASAAATKRVMSLALPVEISGITRSYGLIEQALIALLDVHHGPRRTYHRSRCAGRGPGRLRQWARRLRDGPGQLQ